MLALTVVRDIHKYDGADDNFMRCLLSTMSLALNAYKTFMNAGIEEKRYLINLVFSKLRLKSGQLEYELQQPFDCLMNLSTLRQ